MTLLCRNKQQVEHGQKSVVGLLVLQYLKLGREARLQERFKALILNGNIVIHTIWWITLMVCTDFMPITALAAIGAILSIGAEYRFPLHLAPLDLQHIIAYPFSTREKWLGYSIAETILTIAILIIIACLQLIFGDVPSMLTVANMAMIFTFYMFIFVNGRLIWTRNKKLSYTTVFIAFIGMLPLLLFIGYNGKNTRSIWIDKLNALYIEHELGVFVALCAITIASGILSFLAFRHICTTYPFRHPELVQRLNRKS